MCFWYWTNFPPDLISWRLDSSEHSNRSDLLSNIAHHEPRTASWWTKRESSMASAPSFSPWFALFHLSSNLISLSWPSNSFIQSRNFLFYASFSAYICIQEIKASRPTNLFGHRNRWWGSTYLADCNFRQFEKFFQVSVSRSSNEISRPNVWLPSSVSSVKRSEIH